MAPQIIENYSRSSNTPVEEEDILLSDDLLRLRALDSVQMPLLCFPKSERDIVNYEEFNGRDIDRFVDQGAKCYMKSGLLPVSVPTWQALLYEYI